MSDEVVIVVMIVVMIVMIVMIVVMRNVFLEIGNIITYSD